ncbi:MAG TPA: hypothetical protein VMS08_03615 [Candidatus Saccharimonadia bacterium]|nr:hypothetical protein [Candidatus Saccharimonadia bacterium]
MTERGREAYLALMGEIPLIEIMRIETHILVPELQRRGIVDHECEWFYGKTEKELRDFCEQIP